MVPFFVQMPTSAKTGQVLDAKTDPKTGETVLVDSYVPPQSPGWVRRNFTLGNILAILGTIWAIASWQAAQRGQSALLEQRSVFFEQRLSNLEKAAITRDLFEARMTSVEQRISELSERFRNLDSRK